MTFEQEEEKHKINFFCNCTKSTWLFIRSVIPNIYIAPLQKTYSEALSVQLRPKRNVLRSLQKEDNGLILSDRQYC